MLAKTQGCLRNFRVSEVSHSGKVGVLVRMSDKLSALQSNHQSEKQQVGENVQDTLMDLASYSLIFWPVEEAMTLGQKSAHSCLECCLKVGNHERRITHALCGGKRLSRPS